MIGCLLGVCFREAGALRDGVHLMGGRVHQRRLISVVQVSHGPEQVCFVAGSMLSLENAYEISHAIMLFL